MNILDIEGNDARLVVTRRIAAVKLDVRQLAQLWQRVVDEVLLDGLDAIEGDRLEVVNSRRQAGCTADVLRAGLEFRGSSAYVVSCSSTYSIISPPRRNGGMSSRISYLP